MKKTISPTEDWDDDDFLPKKKYYRKSSNCPDDRPSFSTKDLIEKMQDLKKVPDLYEFALANCFIAGGAVRDSLRNTVPKDYDMFFRTDSAKDEFIAKFGRKCDITGFGNYNWDKFQFITLATGTPEEIIANFDWNVNQVYWDLAATKFGGNISSNMDLIFNAKARTPLSAIMRLPYLIEKGYRIEPKELLFAYTFTTLSVNLADPKVVENQQNFISGNGGAISGIREVTERAVKAVLENSPLMSALK